LLAGDAAQLRIGELQWVGSMAHSNGILYTWHTSDVKTIEDAKLREVSIGGTAVTADSYIFPAAMNGLLGTKFKIILGYPDGSSTDLAVERGELAGRGANSWFGLLTNKRSWFDEKKINLIVQVGFEKEQALPDVPLFLDLVTDPEGRQIA